MTTSGQVTPDTLRLRAAVIGTGFVGPHHVDAARRTGYATVEVLVGSDPGRTAERARSLGVPRWTTEVRATIEDPGIDVVHVCSPNRTHVALGIAVLAAGKHLVLEKPVALDPASAGRLAAVARRSGRHAMVALTYRGYPMVRRARAAVAAGELGEIRLVHGTYLQDWVSDPRDYNWRVDPDAGGPSRAVADIGTHWMDTAEFVTGARVREVFADLAIATLIPVRSRPLGSAAAFARATGEEEQVRVSSEDAATILLRFDGGARGACVISQVSTGRKNAFTLDVDGSLASLSWQQERPEQLWLRARTEFRTLTRDPAEQPAMGVPWLPAGHPEGWGEALRDLVRDFYPAIAAGASPGEAPAPYPTLGDGARSLDLVAAVLESSRRGTWVDVGVPG